jgi:CRISPR-associated endoribonuclease Cas6/Csy4 subtype I-F
MSGVLSILHGCFRRHPGELAIALPCYDHTEQPLNTLRVFSETTDKLEWLVDHVSKHPKIRDYTRIINIKHVPEDWDGEWVEFRRFRVPTRKAGVERLRAKRQAMAKDLPYFNLHSQSSGCVFNLFIEKIKIPKDQLTSGGTPDSYGLSRLSNRVILPEI